MELAIYIGILSAILWFGIGRHEYKSLRRVIDTLDYIEKNRELYIRVGGALIKKPDLEKEGMFENTFESKMLSVDDEHVFVCYAPHTF